MNKHNVLAQKIVHSFADPKVAHDGSCHVIER